MAELCLEACTAVIEHGTPEMRAAARVLLIALGCGLAERSTMQLGQAASED